MNKGGQDLKFVIFGFIILVFLMYLVWNAVEFFITLLRSVDPKISATIIGGMFTIFAGLIVVLLTQRQIKLREISEAHREQKVEIYKGFLDTVEKILQGQNDQTNIKGISEQELIDYLVKFKTNIILWGSPQVLKAQAEFETLSRSGGDMMLALDNLYRAIRTDIGLSNRGLQKYHLVKMYLSDPENLQSFIKGSNNK